MMNQSYLWRVIQAVIISFGLASPAIAHDADIGVWLIPLLGTPILCLAVAIVAILRFIKGAGWHSAYGLILAILPWPFFQFSGAEFMRPYFFATQKFFELFGLFSPNNFFNGVGVFVAVHIALCIIWFHQKLASSEHAN